jgi:hypothetical protein
MAGIVAADRGRLGVAAYQGPAVHGEEFHGGILAGDDDAGRMARGRNDRDEGLLLRPRATIHDEGQVGFLELPELPRPLLDIGASQISVN